jgi:hypothetical protein
MKQVPYCGSTVYNRYHTKFSRHGDLAAGLCSLLVANVKDCLQNSSSVQTNLDTRHKVRS